MICEKCGLEMYRDMSIKGLSQKDRFKYICGCGNISFDGPFRKPIEENDDILNETKK